MSRQGFLLCSTGGLFTVYIDGRQVACSARGVLRQKKTSPVAGDFVMLSDEEDVIESILPRKNFLSRPPCANMDMLVFVISTVDPVPNLRVLDQLLVIAAGEKITPVLVFTKEDRASGEALSALYQKAGYQTFSVNGLTGQGVEPLHRLLEGKTALVLGNSGVGKSTLLNTLEPDLHLSTGETSKKLGRGRHTTRTVSLYPLTGGGWLADTPGFSTVDLLYYGLKNETDLQYAFPEFEPFLNHCRFSDCAHVGEAGCAIGEAVEQGIIAPSRYENYKVFYRELKAVKPWK